MVLKQYIGFIYLKDDSHKNIDGMHAPLQIQIENWGNII